MTNETEFPGYLDIHGAKIHVSEVRRHTTDVHRFREYLPAALEIQGHEPHSPGWLQVLDSSPDLEKLMLTVKELGHLYQAIGDELTRRAKKA